MSLINITAIGITAGVLTTAAFLPQVIKSWKTRSTGDISLSMFIIFTSGVLLWLLYGILQNDLPIILANSITALLCGIILFFKFRFK